MKRFIGLIAVLSLVAAACGGGSSDATSGSSDLENSETTTADSQPLDPNAGSTPSNNDDDARNDPDEPQETSTTTSHPADAGDQSESTLSTTPTYDPPKTEDPPTGSDTPVFEPGDIDQGLTTLIDMAVEDLANRLGVAAADIDVHSAVLVVWPDSSLGCPHPDMQYLQVPVDGALIELAHSGRIYRYHTGGNNTTPFYCEQPLKQVPPVGDIGN